MQVLNTQQAEELINKCKIEYNADKFNFEMQLSMFFSGDHNKKIRADILEYLTGKRPPVTKARLSAITDTLKAKFEQFTLF
jgi:hypothetical protein